MIINLHITTWQGVSLGAVHWYAELQADREYRNVELKNILTPRQAARLNKNSIFRDEYMAGDEHRGFDTYEDAIEAGIKHWKVHFPEAKFLVLGTSRNIEPKLILDSSLDDDTDIKAKVQAIIDKCEAIGWYDKAENDAIMDEYYNEWAKLVGAVIYE